jgi:hypothetical protein
MSAIVIQKQIDAVIFDMVGSLIEGPGDSNFDETNDLAVE